MSQDKQSNELPSSKELAWAKIVGETAKIEWKQLQKFFAAGHVLHVQDDLDLVQVAYHFSNDDAETLKPWVEDEKIAAVSDEQALQWFEDDAIVWSCVVRPWVLVQGKKPD